MAMMVSKIGIIGAGISGIAAAKQLAEHDPVVLEASDSIGGVWKHCSYRSTKLQTPRCDFEFSDFPWPQRDNSSFPTYLEILDYLHSYAAHFDVLKFVRFRSKAVQIRFLGEQETNDYHSYSGLLNGKPVWEVAVQTQSSDTIQVYGFEFLVICTGKYGDMARMPSFPHKKGPEAFKGKVLHTLDYCKLDHQAATQLLKGNKVVVIGYKKSAIDLAVECAEANQGAEGKACTMVIRTLHWTVPHYSVWGLPFYLFYSTRLSQFLHYRPNQGFLRNILCRLLSPVRRAASKIIESYLEWKLPLVKYGLRPDHSFEEDYASCQMAILPDNFFSEADKGNIQFKKADKWWFYEDGLQFDDGTRLDADLVILATGFDGKQKLKAILPEPFRSLIDFHSGMMPLYRGTIHPLIPSMGFVGFIESVSNLQTAEIRCKWLSRLIGGQHFRLPGVERMIEQTTKEMEIMKTITRFYKRHCISTFSINHSDEICEEMGVQSWRKKTWLAEIFSPYNSQDYADDEEEEEEEDK